MTDYRVLLVDASTGHNLGEMTTFVFDSPFTRVLSGCGDVSGHLPLDDPMATTSMLQGDRELTILRNDVPVWNGPITALDASFSTRVVNITAREASWYFGKRTLEIDKNYNADLYYIVRNLVTYMTTKTSNGTTGGSSINAALPRFSVSPASGNSGTTKAVHYYGTARHTIADIINDLVADPSTGLDYRMDYTSASSRQNCQRVMTLGVPLGSTLNQNLTEHVLYDFQKQEDRDRAAIRVHTVGAGYTYTLQNTGAVSAGEILIEAVFDRSDTSNQTVIQNYTKDARRLTQPPVAPYSYTYVPGAALPYGWCDLGDKIYANVGGTTILYSQGFRRVIQIAVTPPTDSTPELVALTVNLPLDQLGT